MFAEYLSDNTKRRRRRYDDSDILTLKQIWELSQAGVSLSDIGERLQIVETGGEIESSLAMLPTINAQFERVRTLFSEIQQNAQDQAETIETMQTTIDALTARLERVETPWYQRLFGRSDPEG